MRRAGTVASSDYKPNFGVSTRWLDGFRLTVNQFHAGRDGNSTRVSGRDEGVSSVGLNRSLTVNGQNVSSSPVPCLLCAVFALSANPRQHAQPVLSSERTSFYS